MNRKHWVLVGALVLVHIILMTVVPSSEKLNDDEIKALTGGLMGFSELIPCIDSGAISPHPVPFWVFSGTLAKMTRDPFLLRIPSMIFSILTLILIVRTGFRHLSLDAGFVAAALYAVSLPVIRTAKTYGADSGFVLLSLLVLHFFLSGWRRQGTRPWMAFLLAIVAVLYWHYYGVVILLLQWVILGATLLWQGKLHRSREPAKPPIGEALVSLGLATIAFMPWFIFVTRVTPLPRVITPASAFEYYGLLLKAFGFGSYLGAGIVSVLAVVGVIRGLQIERISLPSGKVRITTKTLLPTFIISGAIVLYALSMFAYHRATSTVYFPGGITVFLPMFLLLVGIGVSRLSFWITGLVTARRVALVLFLGMLLSIIGWTGRDVDDRLRADTWEKVVSFLSEKIREGDVVIVQPSEAQVFLMWAASREEWVHLIKGEEWFSGYDAGPIVDRLSTIWLCRRQNPKPGQPETVKMSRLAKIGSIDIGTEDAVPYYVNNVDRKLETNPDSRKPFTFSWALDSRAKLNFPLESNRAAGAIIFRAAPFRIPQRLTVDLNKVRKFSIDMEPDWKHYIVTFRPQWLGGQRARLGFHFTSHRSLVSPEGIPWRPKAVAFDYAGIFAMEEIMQFPEAPVEKEEETKDPRRRRMRRAAPRKGRRF